MRHETLSNHESQRTANGRRIKGIEGPFVERSHVLGVRNMTVILPESWKSHIDDILSSPGVTVVVGDTDTGKTSFCTRLANSAFEAGVSTAVVDSDIGQSEIGPPTTIGLGLVDAEIETLSDVKPRSLYFVGTTSPMGHLLPISTGTKKLATSTLVQDRRLIIVDTPGLIQGMIGRKLHTNTIELLSARHIVALQKSQEAEHFLRFFDTWEDCTIHRLPALTGIRPKTPTMRTQRRTARFREYFQSGNIHQLSLQDLRTSGTWLNTGVQLQMRYLKFAENELGTEVLHGELTGKGIYLVVKSDYNKDGVEALQAQFKTKNVVIVPAHRYLNLLVGLLDSHLELLALGIVQKIGFLSQTISVLTPLRSIGPVRSIRFGVSKVRNDGTEIGRLHPGEL